MRRVKILAAGLAWVCMRSAGLCAEEATPCDARWAMSLFHEPALTMGTQTVYRLTSTADLSRKHPLAIGGTMGGYRLLGEEESIDGRGLRLEASNHHVVVRARSPGGIWMNERWAVVPGLSAFVECGETNIPLDGAAVAWLVITNSGPQALELDVTGFSALLYQGADAEENLWGFRTSECEWRGERPMVLAPGGAAKQEFSWNLSDVYLPSGALVEGGAGIRGTVRMQLDGAGADLHVREARVQLVEPRIFQMEPVLILDKRRHVPGESVRFWAGVGGPENQSIPFEYWENCFLHVVCPDGRVEKWPMDWFSPKPVLMENTGTTFWTPADPHAGIYSLVFEFAGNKTPPSEVEFLPSDILNRLAMEFIPDGQAEADSTLPLVLKIDNRLPHQVLLPAAGTRDHPVRMIVREADSRNARGMIYPWRVVPEGEERSSHAQQTWADRSEIPLIVIPAEETREYSVAVGKYFMFLMPGDYDVELYLTIPVMIEETGGEFDNHGPMVVPIRWRGEIVVR